MKVVDYGRRKGNRLSGGVLSRSARRWSLRWEASVNRPGACGVPTVFISYSHDSEAHKTWVRTLAERLTQDGICIVLDQWHLSLGDDLPGFMEKNVAEADYVLLICTETYITRADVRAGGVGYESGLLASLLLNPQQIAAKSPTRLIPVVRQASNPRRLPRFAHSRVYADLSVDAVRPDLAYEELVRTLHGTPKHEPPPFGSNPYASTQNSSGPQAPSETPPVKEVTVRDALRSLRSARADGAQRLVQEQPHFAALAGATEEQRDDELLKVLSAHEDYLARLVRVVQTGKLDSRLIADEIEDVMAPKDWQRSGFKRVVDLPVILGWAVHRLAGAVQLEIGRAGEALDLAREDVRLPDEEAQPIIATRRMTGWPIYLGSSTEAWESSRTWPTRFPWLLEVFGDAEQYWIATVAHALVLNWAEFCWRVQNGPSFAQIRQDREHGPYLPLQFWTESKEVQRQALRLVRHDLSGLHARLELLTHIENLSGRWQQWIEFQRAWIAIESRGRAGSGPAPNAELFSMVLAAR